MGPGPENVAEGPAPFAAPAAPATAREPPPASSVCAPVATDVERMFCMDHAGVHSAPLELAAMPLGPVVVKAPPRVPACQMTSPAGGAAGVPAGQSEGQGQDTGSAAPPAQKAPAGQGVPDADVAAIQHARPAGTEVQAPEHSGEVRAVLLPNVPAGQGRGTSTPAGQKKPSGQGAQWPGEEEPAGEKKPGAHGIGTREPCGQ
jgi:hypothetical protein